jgi:hypothetical protein
MEDSVRSMDAFLAKDGVTDVPIALDPDATDFGGRLTYQFRLAPHAVRYRSNADAENGVTLYRRLLAAADSPVEILEIGFLQVFSALLESRGDEISPKTGRELVAQKVSHCWVMAGKWDADGEKEHNFARNPRARIAAGLCFKIIGCLVEDHRFADDFRNRKAIGQKCRKRPAPYR